MNTILKKQRDFQKLVEFPIDTILERERNEMSEKYVLKMIEEIIEFRREFPSVMNPWSKNNKEANLDRIKEELSDVFLFFCNILLTWRIDWEDFLIQVKKIQETNFAKVKFRKMEILNLKMLSLPGYIIGLGQGNLSPKYVFIGQNPGQNIVHGYKVWSNPEDGSSKILLPILERHDILKDCYFTNLVKSTTLNNQEPTQDSVKFWLEYLREELKILGIANQDMKIVTMGSFTSSSIGLDSGYYTIQIKHPAYYLRNNNIKEYENEILSSL